MFLSDKSYRRIIIGQVFPVSAGDINNGNVEIKEMMKFLGTVFQVDLGDYYASYIAMKERKDRTAYLHHLIDSLIKRMNEDDMK